MWWSHMLDFALFGPRPGWHHLVNVLFHAADTLLLFALLLRMTGRLWRSALVAALFALHPLHVESVAWLAERKDLLCALFWLLSVGAYVEYAREGSRRKRQRCYALALGFFALGLMSKPMVVTLPLVLLLLDFWPLQRFSGPRVPAGLIREKWPFLALTLVSCVVTFLTVRSGNHIASSEAIPWSLRLANVPVAYVRYLGKVVWPSPLVVLYPMPGHWPAWQVIGATLVILLLTWAVLLGARWAGYLVFGWFMFLGTLVPTIGLVSVGSQSIADRYMYLPSIGLFTAVVWLVAEVTRRWSNRAVILGGAAVASLLALGIAARVQVHYWRDTETLWRHCLAAGAESVMAHYSLGRELMNSGRVDEAMTEFQNGLPLDAGHVDAMMDLGVAFAHRGQLGMATNWLARAVRVAPGYSKARVNLALALLQAGDAAGAERQCTEAIRLDAANAGAWSSLGIAVGAQGRSDEAMEDYAKALVLDPDFAEARLYLGREWLARARYGDAVSNLDAAARLIPAMPEAHLLLARALAGSRQTGRAIAEFRATLGLNPNQPEALNQLAWILATAADPGLRNGAEAVQMAERACSATSLQQPVYLDTLAAAYAEEGNFDQAARAVQRAGELAGLRGETNLLQINRVLTERVQARQPYHEPN
jgi:Tfp pilus assembly protein PilF